MFFEKCHASHRKYVSHNKSTNMENPLTKVTLATSATAVFLDGLRLLFFFLRNIDLRPGDLRCFLSLE